MPRVDAAEQLEIARQHLERVLSAWDEPTDWADLSLYGFYCLEAAVMAAGAHLSWDLRRTHPAKADAATRLAEEYDLPDITDLLWTLNDARKATAYGDIDFPELDAENVAAAVESYVEAVADLVESGEQG